MKTTMKVLALIEGANEVCCRYRIRAFGEFLAERGATLEVACLHKGILKKLSDLHKAKDADVVILQRKLMPLWQIYLLRTWANRLIFDFDDAVFQRDSNSAKGSASWSRLARFRAVAYEADLVIAGNDYLRRAALDCTWPDRLCVVPTCIDTKKYRPAVHKRTGLQARLVWIGQQTTLQSLGKAEGEMAAIARRMPGMEFRQICDRSAAMAGFNVVLRPWSEKTEAGELAQGDIGIAWMPDDSWSLGKCGLKVLQYMAAGLPVVANPVGIHKEMIIDGETGYLADTPDAWAEAVARLAFNPLLRKKMGDAARHWVEEKYSVAAWGPTFAERVLHGVEMGAQQAEVRKAA
jgi:hypothetical protein